MPSVTEVLGYSTPPPLVEWFKRNSKAKSEAIAASTSEIGQGVDTLVQQDIKEGGYVPPFDSDPMNNCLAGWEKVKTEHPGFIESVTEMQTELRVGEMVGHPDFIHGTVPWGITDLKCTSGIRTKNWIQTAKYARMLMEERGWPMPAFLRIIRLKRDEPTYEWLEITEKDMIKYCMDSFDHYLGVFNDEPFLKEYFRSKLEEDILDV